MHAIMGAEFTATSMIGWIALAGIIVRNSILLVDFSVHEVQRGVPVTEAVIRACKTRTRPIMITALALVCGSSVIFTDPIFQGMAISLASGVMVSTILTLIVIPLGCIKASKSLLEVAAIASSSGMPLPLEEAQPEPKPSLPKTPILIRIWSGTISVLLMLFYAIRGIFLLLGQFFKRKPKPTATLSTPPPATPVSGGGEGNPPASPASGGNTTTATTVEKSAIKKGVRKTALSRKVSKTGVPEVAVTKAPAERRRTKAVNPASSLLLKTPLETKSGPAKSSAGAGSKIQTKRNPKKSAESEITLPAKKSAVEKSTKSVVKATPAIKKPTKSRIQERPKKEGRRGIRLKISDTDGIES